MSRDPELVHKEWLGYVQPTGLVVSIPALLEASAVLNQNYGPEHQQFLSALPRNGDGEPVPEIPDFVHFAQQVLHWDTSLLLGAPGSAPVPTDLEINLENYNETLRPTYALRKLDGDSPWLLLVTVLPTGTDLDDPYAPHDRGWQASPQVRFERLLKQTKVPVGLLVNDREVRLVYAPEKELSGHITFKIPEMVQVAGRPILAALQMLLDSERLYSVAEKERLPAILANSRKYQNVVSTKLAEQVVEALYELLRGFQAANDQFKGELLQDVLQRDPDEVYRGLLTTLLRLVFVLYAEDRGLLSTDPIYSNYYSVTGLYERLRGDDGRYKDTMDQRYGAWAQLLSLFRLIYSGGSHGGMRIPAREGYLFDRDRYLFLEGRHSRKHKPQIPRVPDGVVYRVLSKLLLLDGERLSYRTLAVEQIGSVYEAIMGFELKVADGQSIAIKSAKRHGAPTTINLEELLRTPGEKRQKWFTDATDQNLTGQAADSLKTAATIEQLLAAFDKKISKAVTPNTVPKGAMIFQPSHERRKSGSHYTPSSLTGPIVEAALEPVLKQLGYNPTPEQILNLKVCDPAMGSGAFLVEACRQLGDALAKAWHAHDDVPPIPPDEDEALLAQRLVAQRCVYGVDKNGMAVDLAKLSLWLATLAKNHPFTFLDHSLRHGDSLIGLTRQQIAAFHWQPAGQRSLFEDRLRKDIERVSHYRQRILAAREDRPYSQLKQELDGAEESLRAAKEVGDTIVAAFFSARKPKEREEKLLELRALTEITLKDETATANQVVETMIGALRKDPKGVIPFHWELEFPEVFGTKAHHLARNGFDVIIGNPPFMGGTLIGGRLGLTYHDFLGTYYAPATGLADIIAFFVRRFFTLIRSEGTVGTIATNTVAQGDTREAGLQSVLSSGGVLYKAQRRYPWPGEAAVVVSLIHIHKTSQPVQPFLDGKPVARISAYLLSGNVDTTPLCLHDNKGLCYRGTKIWGSGFVFEENPSNGSSSLSEMEHLLSDDPSNKEVIFSYLGGEDFNTSPAQRPSRFVIDFGSMSEAQARKWPALFSIVEERVRPIRAHNKQRNYRDNWWLHTNRVEDAGPFLQQHGRLLALTCVSQHLALAFVPVGTIIQDRMIVLLLHEDSDFAVLQSRVHEVWARMVGTTLGDALSYTTVCFDTFPRPHCADRSQLERAGAQYRQFREEALMNNNEGLTKLYNRFHDPEERSKEILRLRALHDELDRSVLAAYGWSDIGLECDFFPEFGEGEEDVSEASLDKTKKHRYRWPDQIRDVVVAKVLELNRQRALEEGQLLLDDAATTTVTKLKKAPGKKSNAKTPEPTATPTLFAKSAGEV